MLKYNGSKAQSDMNITYLIKDWHSYSLTTTLRRFKSVRKAIKYLRGKGTFVYKLFKVYIAL